MHALDFESPSRDVLIEPQRDDGQFRVVEGKPFLGRAGWKRLPLAVMAVLAWATSPSHAQFSYYQSFDSIGPSGTTLPLLWTAGYLGAESSVNRAVMAPYAGNGLSLTPMPMVVSDGSALPSPNVGAVFNLGASGSLDRAVGGYPRTTPSGDQVIQVVIRNFTGAPLEAIHLSYWGEQWRQSQGTSSSGPEMLRVLASTTSATSGFTYFPALDFVAPKQTVADAPVGGLDGNAAGNRVFISDYINFPVPVPDGAPFYIRWHDWNDNGTSDHFLAIDDVRITLIPEPATAAILVLGLGALIGARRRRD